MCCLPIWKEWFYEKDHKYPDSNGNVVDIDVNNMYSLETDFSKYGAAPIFITSLATEKSYAVSIDSQAMDTALGYLMTGFFIESDCFGTFGSDASEL